MAEATVLITGGAGFIGSHLTDALLAKGYAVRVLDDLSTGKRSNLPLDNPKVELMVGDVADAALVARAMQGCNAVAHLAAVASVQASRYLPLSRPLFFYVNDQTLKSNPALRSMIVATLEHGVKVAQGAGVIPLQDSTYRLVTNKLYRNVLGSAFAGKLPIGLTVGQVLERSFDEHKKPQFR